jgi:hypothetical protein
VPESKIVQSTRFLGWRQTARHGTKAVHYFLNLEQQSIRSRNATVRSRYRVQQLRDLHTRQTNITASTAIPSVLPGILLRPSLPAGALPSAVITGDFNGDGKLDWLVANAGDDSLDLYLGNGDGSAQPPIIIPLLGQSPVAVAAGDLNGDGKLDLVVAEADSDSIGILFGNGDGTFQPEVELPAFPVQTLAVALADVSKDGHLDIIVGVAGNPQTPTNGPFAVLLNNGTGGFGAPIYAPNPSSSEIPSADELSVADVNGDGFPDVVATTTGGNVQVFLGKGDGTFTVGQLVDQSSGGTISRLIQNAVLGDVNGDGCPDVVDADDESVVRIFLGDCKGNFNTTNPPVYEMGDDAYGLAVADINGDGHPDLIIGGVPLPQDTLAFVGDVTGDTVGVRLNDGTGHFGPLHVYRGDPGIFSLAVGDLSGNGHPDIITANQNADTTSVYLNDGTGEFGEPEGGYDGEVEGSVNGYLNPPKSGFLVTDVNGDGLPDLTLIEANDISTSLFQITVMLNQGNGQFSAPIRTPAFRSDYIVNDFTFAAFRKTGQKDFLGASFDDSTNCGQPQLIYAPNTGNGSFGSPVQIPLTLTNACFSFPILGVGDFNNDGNLDFAVVSPTGPSTAPIEVTVYLGNGDGTFQPPRQADFALPPGVDNSPYAVFVGDANGDGKPDIFVWDSNNVYGAPPTGKDLLEFLGNGDGTFQPPRDVLQSLYAMTMRDLDHDGRLDVIDINSGSPPAEYAPGTAPPVVSIYLGQPDGSFSLAQTYSPFSDDLDAFFGNTASNGPNDQIVMPYIGDFNGDGNTDIALIQLQGNGAAPAFAQFLVGNGDGTFTPAYDIYPLRIQYAPDLAAENVFGDGHAAFIQAPNFPASYHILRSNTAPSFQIQPDETPVFGSKDALDISLNTPATSDTTVSLSSNDANVLLPASATIPAGTLSIQVPFTLSISIAQDRWFSITGQANRETHVVYDFTARPGLDSYTLDVAPPPLDTVQPGGISELWAAGVQANGDASGTFQISCSGLPTGLSCQFLNGTSSSTVDTNSSFIGSDFSILATPNVAFGTYAFNVVASDGYNTLVAPETIQVPAPPPPAPIVNFEPSQVSFPTSLVGTSQNQTESLVNQGNATLQITGITAQSGANGTFSQSNNCGSSLAAGTYCTITVTFNASSVGSSSGTLSVSDNAAGSPQSIPITASAGDFAVQPAAGGSTTLTVSPGTSAVFSLQVAPNNFVGWVYLSCSGAIPEGSCAIQPSPISMSGSSPAGFQATVTTTAPSGGGFLVPVRFRPGLPTVPIVAFAVFILAMALLMAFVRDGENQYRARTLRGIAVVLLVTSVLALAGCGGGGGQVSGGNPGTTPGSYPFTITASAGGGTRSLQITVVVK